MFYVAETVELRKQCASEMVLKNPTGTKLAFKVKTTSPKKYCVKPNTGIDRRARWRDESDGDDAGAP